MKSEIMNYGKLVDELFQFYKTTIAPSKNKKWEYNGYDTTSTTILATSPSVKKQLSKEEFEFRVNYKDKHPIELLINAAVQLGIQLGINLCSQYPKEYLEK